MRSCVIGEGKMKVLVVGSSGLVGKALTKELSAKGHDVYSLVREQKAVKEKNILWDPVSGKVDSSKLEGMDAVVNLAGENVASGRWTPQKKKKIWDSRVLGTKNLIRAFQALKTPPKLLINASAIGYYGETGDQPADEKTSRGSHFLSSVTADWEDAANEAKKLDMRLVKLRIGVVLATEGGALKKMLVPFRLGLGGQVSHGRQYMSWIALQDLVSIILFSLENKEVEGAVNAVAPNPVTNKEFTKTLGKVLCRPTIFPLPAIIARFIMGEMADELLLVSSRIAPKALKKYGYTFKHPHLKEALESILNETGE